MKIHRESNVKKVEKTSSGALLVHLDSQSEPIETDVLLWAIGRHGNTNNLGLEAVGVKTNEKGDVVADEYQNTAVEHIYSLGDVVGKVELTPVAIAAGRKLSNRLFGGEKFKNDKLNYNDIPSVVFRRVSLPGTLITLLIVRSHPTIGAIGLTEPQAREKYGDAVKVYKSTVSGPRTPQYLPAC